MSKCPIYISLVEALAILNSREVIDVDLIAEAQRVIDVRVKMLQARVDDLKVGNIEDSSEEPRESTKSKDEFLKKAFDSFKEIYKKI